MMVRIPDELHQKLHQLKKMGYNMTAVIRIAVAREVDARLKQARERGELQ